MTLLVTNDQVKQLAKAHFSGDDDAFRSSLLQMAAYEAKRGHSQAAREFKILADRQRQKSKILNLTQVEGLFQISYPAIPLNRLIISNTLMVKLQRVIDEYRQRGKLADYGYANRRRILLEGAPGTGKTMTAAVIASELSLPLFTVQMDKLITKYMGETSVKIRQIFSAIERNVGVYLFDEFDAIGADRSLDNEVGEMRRILNSFLQFIENDKSDSIIVAATNNRQMLDPALFRRFDDVLHYELPTIEEAKYIIDAVVSGYDTTFYASDELAGKASLLCQAEIVQVCNDAIKGSLLSGDPITENILSLLFDERLGVYEIDQKVG